jgi:hypothetical protein
MRDIHLHPSDAAELAELLTFLGDWLTGAQGDVLAPSLARFVGHPGYDITALHSDLRRFVFLLAASDGDDLFS